MVYKAMKRNKRGGYRLLYADPEDAEFVDFLSDCMRVDRKELIRLAISLLALMVLAPDESYALFTKVLNRIKRRR